MTATLRTLLVIPSYRDSARVAPFLDDLRRTLPAHFRVRVVDDGSGPDEARRLREVVEKARVAGSACAILDPLIEPVNQGKGGAICAGWRDPGDADLLMFADADGAVCAAEIVRAESAFRASGEWHALLGSRVKKLGRTVERRLSRHLLGRVFATVVSVATGLAVYDSQCGLKIVCREAFEKISPRLTSLRFAFDVELLLLLVQSGARVVEFPVDWREVPGSRLNLATDSLRMVADVLDITRRHGRC